MFYAASIKRPYAEAIVERRKLIEYRTWCPRLVSPGELIVIHASRHKRSDRPEIIGLAEVAGYLRRSDFRTLKQCQAAAQAMYGTPAGAVNLPVAEAVTNWWNSGAKCGWLFKDATRINPVAVPGGLGVWPVTVGL